MTAEQIHSLGEQEVKRIEGEMQSILTELNFKGSIEDFQKYLDSTSDQHFHSKDEMLAYCRNIAKIIEPELPNQFHHLPMLLYGVRPIPPDREAATATNAQAPSPDYTTPGWFNLNTYKPEKQVKYDKESLVLHEAVPGHIFQITLAESQKGLPDIRKFYSNSAYVEGWALYSESLGAQLGLYKNPYSRFGQLASERFRAVRLVVDTGIHDLGWTRQQAIEYFQAHAPEESLAEIDRYISWPAQALSYKMGQLRIVSLRKAAEQRLGSKFDVREFNDAVIRDGTLPLDLLSEQINEFIGQAAGQ
jgi:prolyl oligopeptidase